ncbi:Cyclic nucleotide-binding protein [Pseudocohnilembus persalinus]|uniref:Cyclic nucleotide-binding protein n=1 Tax=Pseudocohnilembus persalinus TaxID=266149 RepID=A0A0V0QRG7_PSEPJ|nr:Cyclic nucleotide-binding protein [Pseudocohnilembus persalinus]|eukprot:KRX04859.1 Cyclic nucleotide-binding protein [Pseudocohnilembus persalinus]
MQNSSYKLDLEKYNQNNLNIEKQPLDILRRSSYRASNTKKAQNLMLLSQQPQSGKKLSIQQSDSYNENQSIYTANGVSPPQKRQGNKRKSQNFVLPKSKFRKEKSKILSNQTLNGLQNQNQKQNLTQTQTYNQMGKLKNIFLLLKMKEFARQWVSKIGSRKFQYLKAHHYNLLADASLQQNLYSEMEQQSLNLCQKVIKAIINTKQITKCMKSLDICSSQIKVFSPSHWSILIWDCLVAFAYVLLFFLVPISVAINKQIDDLFQILFEALQTKNLENTWMAYNQVYQDTWKIQYIYSLYFFVVTMCTVGYGDVSPVGNNEILLSIFTMLVACGVFAHCINAIGQMFQFVSQERNINQKNMVAINQFMYKKKISFKLQYQIREYLEYYWRENKEVDSQLELGVFSQLSDDLKHQLLLDANKVVLSESSVFKTNFSDKFISNCVSIIQEKFHQPGQIVKTQYEEKGEACIYFIEEGEIEFYIEQQNKQDSSRRIHTLKRMKSGYFGFYSFFTGLNEKYKVRTLDFTKLLVIKKNDFVELIKNYNDDYEKFCYIRDQLILNEDSSQIGQKCSCCGSISHDFLTCSLIHQTFDPYKVEENSDMESETSEESSSSSIMNDIQSQISQNYIKEVIEENEQDTYIQSKKKSIKLSKQNQKLNQSNQGVFNKINNFFDDEMDDLIEENSYILNQNSEQSQKIETDKILVKCNKQDKNEMNIEENNFKDHNSNISSSINSNKKSQKNDDTDTKNSLLDIQNVITAQKSTIQSEQINIKKIEQDNNQQVKLKTDIDCNHDKISSKMSNSSSIKLDTYENFLYNQEQKSPTLFSKKDFIIEPYDASPINDIYKSYIKMNSQKNKKKNHRFVQQQQKMEYYQQTNSIEKSPQQTKNRLQNYHTSENNIYDITNKYETNLNDKQEIIPKKRKSKLNIKKYQLNDITEKNSVETDKKSQQENLYKSQGRKSLILQGDQYHKRFSMGANTCSMLQSKENYNSNQDKNNNNNINDDIQNHSKDNNNNNINQGQQQKQEEQQLFYYNDNFFDNEWNLDSCQLKNINVENDMDCFKNFEYYFPKHNVSTMLKKFESAQERKIMQKMLQYQNNNKKKYRQVKKQLARYQQLGSIIITENPSDMESQTDYSDATQNQISRKQLNMLKSGNGMLESNQRLSLQSQNLCDFMKSSMQRGKSMGRSYQPSKKKKFIECQLHPGQKIKAICLKKECQNSYRMACFQCQTNSHNEDLQNFVNLKEIKQLTDKQNVLDENQLKQVISDFKQDILSKLEYMENKVNSYLEIKQQKISEYVQKFTQDINQIYSLNNFKQCINEVYSGNMNQEQFNKEVESFINDEKKAKFKQNVGQKFEQIKNFNDFGLLTHDLEEPIKIMHNISAQLNTLVNKITNTGQINLISGKIDKNVNNNIFQFGVKQEGDNVDVDQVIFESAIGQSKPKIFDINASKLRFRIQNLQEDFSKFQLCCGIYSKQDGGRPEENGTYVELGEKIIAKTKGEIMIKKWEKIFKQLQGKQQKQLFVVVHFNPQESLFQLTITTDNSQDEQIIFNNKENFNDPQKNDWVFYTKSENQNNMEIEFTDFHLE